MFSSSIHARKHHSKVTSMLRKVRRTILPKREFGRLSRNKVFQIKSGHIIKSKNGLKCQQNLYAKSTHRYNSWKKARKKDTSRYLVLNRKCPKWWAEFLSQLFGLPKIEFLKIMSETMHIGPGTHSTSISSNINNIKAVSDHKINELCILASKHFRATTGWVLRKGKVWMSQKSKTTFLMLVLARRNLNMQLQTFWNLAITVIYLVSFIVAVNFNSIFACDNGLSNQPITVVHKSSDNHVTERIQTCATIINSQNAFGRHH